MKRREASELYILFYKPYGVLSQFTSPDRKLCLKDFGPFPKGVYPVGRLDFDSEGLLLLTNDRVVNHRLTDPRFEHEKTYLVQVEGVPTTDAIRSLRNGVDVQGRTTLPSQIRLLDHPPSLPERSTPIRERKTVPTTWLEITLREGRNRQVRRMTAAVGYPTLRLVRVRIAALTVGTLNPGEHRTLAQKEISALRRMVKQ
jgi:23S rRNA pseudouridine2457 synthase